MTKQKLSSRLSEIQTKIENGPETPAMDDEVTLCLNCGDNFTGNYCPRCGQSRKVSAGFFKRDLRRLLTSLFGLNSALWTTIKELLYRPGYMIKDFLAGKRARYIEPFRCLVVLSAIYMIVLSIMATPEFSKRRPIRDRYMTDSSPQVTLFLDKIDQYLETNLLLDNTVAWLLQAMDSKGLKYFLRIPVLALLAMWAFRRKDGLVKYNYSEFFVAQTYISCQKLIFIMLFMPFNGYVQVNDSPGLPIWFSTALMWLSYKQLFGLSWLKSLWRLIQIYLYLLVIMLVIFVLVVLMLS